jgi:MurNAc alpha-1-phosphate uridylyltransferase
MRAMILAAGRGKRLSPLTDNLPKPLVEIAGKPLIVYHLERLAASGIQEIVINVSYLAQKIIDTLGDGRQFGVKITYSIEAEPLEVAGGIINALPLLGDKPFILLNGDIWTDYPVQQLIQHAEHFNKLAHLVLVNTTSRHPAGDLV